MNIYMNIFMYVYKVKVKACIEAISPYRSHQHLLGETTEITLTIDPIIINTNL